MYEKIFLGKSGWVGAMVQIQLQKNMMPKFGFLLKLTNINHWPGYSNVKWTSANRPQYLKASFHKCKKLPIL